MCISVSVMGWTLWKCLLLSSGYKVSCCDQPWCEHLTGNNFTPGQTNPTLPARKGSFSLPILLSSAGMCLQTAEATSTEEDISLPHSIMAASLRFNCCHPFFPYGLASFQMVLKLCLEKNKLNQWHVKPLKMWNLIIYCLEWEPKSLDTQKHEPKSQSFID